MSDIHDYRADHLLLLVGSNPVPNAVAGKLLTTPGATLTLIHSADGLLLAQRLGSWFRNAGYAHIGFTQVEESDAASVYKHVYGMLEQYERDSARTKQPRVARVGLNYTGGTKVMSVQAYLAVERWAGERKMEVVFSYLDARTLQLRVEQTRSKPALSFYVGLEVTISIRDVLELHNWELAKEPVTVPVLPESAAALLAIHGSAADAGIWAEWLRTELFPVARKRKKLQEQYDVEQPAPNDKWKSNATLRSLAVPWPNLPTLRETMRKELGQDSTEQLSLQAGPGANRNKNEEAFCRWLSGIWLESAVLSALQQCALELHLDECCMDLRPKVLGSTSGGELFQFDVVAIRGYQLFAFSCTTESGKGGGGRGLLKHKLFEAYVRARQMGGDEACVALVCCMSQEEADKLEDEMRRDMSSQGRIQVFSRECLQDLTRHIADWIRQQSRES